MNEIKLRNFNLKEMPDGDLFEEVALRLRKQYLTQFNEQFLYGCFEFIFHKGKFIGVEDRPRFKRYSGADRLVLIDEKENQSERNRR